jgi:hypothetical protein
MWKQGLIAIGMALPLLAGDRGTDQTTRFKVAEAGAIRLENSVGEVDIDGWDRPEVEVTVVREHSYGATQQRLDTVQFTTKQEGNDVVISTVYPPRGGFLHVLSRRSDVGIRYSIHAPRASKLMIEHHSGGVNVADLRGDIHALVVNGQITLTLPEAQYAIDAKCRIGSVYSDFEGHDRRSHVLGKEFDRQSPAPATNLYLRVRVGDIVILKMTGPPTE